MNNLTVRAKLTWAFGLLALVVLLVSGFAIKSLSDADRRFDGFVNGITERLDMAGHVRSAVAHRAIAARNLVLVTSPEDMAVEKEKVLAAHKEATESMSKLKQMGQANDVSEEARRLIAEMDRVEKAYAPVALDIVDKAMTKRRDEAVEKMNKECRPLLASLDKAVQAYVDFVRTVSDKRVEAAAADYAAQRNLLIGACALAFLLAGGAGVLLTRSLTRALGGEPAELGAAIQRVADGDLSVRIEPRSGDDSSVMATAARMQTALSLLVSSVRQNSESVATASAQIAQGNQDLSSRTEQQASALQQTAATMDQLGTTVRNNADSAKQANQLAQGASAVAAQGGEVVGKVVTTMQGINDSSRKIGDIISVIDGIAFQTNILALNAAVEAARAGEQGRGFAVVASEVRSLAQRSAEAAKEIKTLIGRSVEQVEQGTALVDQAGKTMGEIVGSIQRVSDIVAEITSASAEQSSGVQQVGEAVSQMDQATQQNAALVEESAAAAESLKGQALQLVQAVAMFKLSPGGHAGAADAAAPGANEPSGERRGPNRAKNVTRPAFKAKRATAPAQTLRPSPGANASARTGTDDWASF
ncbi:methyl-accepting chemotaxis protein [Rubrivivax gelatinosus]|uniref:Methyl-accepting chemotaxis protein n=1 Tax=Rubrivivax gelatinosus TaxID=28068 RepID=A0ABS1DSJ4_RUBGE|nr:methyl-accepting chemotaxis protein [Rubrivivax gelatinosus]MBK1712918.1 methyl-accepting chemotaxis protein [Rubrivivax gelatinosus]